MNNLLKNHIVVDGLNKISGYDFIMFIVAIILIIGAVSAATIKLYKFVERYRKTRNELEEKNGMLKTHSNAIKDLTEDSISMKNNIEVINNKMDDLHEIITNLITEQNTREMATLKDRIRQSYSYYNQKKEWSSMEKESLEGLIKSYENCGGENSFVHSIVEKEMYNWKVID